MSADCTHSQNALPNNIFFRRLCPWYAASIPLLIIIPVMRIYPQTWHCAEYRVMMVSFRDSSVLVPQVNTARATIESGLVSLSGYTQLQSVVNSILPMSLQVQICRTKPFMKSLSKKIYVCSRIHDPPGHYVPKYVTSPSVFLVPMS